MENDFDLIDLGLLGDLVDQEKDKVLNEINKSLSYKNDLSIFFVEKLQNLNTLSRKIILAREQKRR